MMSDASKLKTARIRVQLTAADKKIALSMFKEGEALSTINSRFHKVSMATVVAALCEELGVSELPNRHSRKATTNPERVGRGPLAVSAYNRQRRKHAKASSGETTGAEPDGT